MKRPSGIDRAGSRPIRGETWFFHPAYSRTAHEYTDSSNSNLISFRCFLAIR
jgi:hypothetical protein